MKKSVTFDESKNKVHLVIAWEFAYRKSREWNYEAFANKAHFRRRIDNMEHLLKNILDNKVNVYKEWKIKQVS